MDMHTKMFLLNLILSVICETGLPVEGQRTEILERSLKKNMAVAQKKYMNKHKAYKVLNKDWFHAYLCRGTSIQGLYRYILEEDFWSWSKNLYIRELASDAKSYADIWAGGLSDMEEMALRNFYRMLMLALRETVRPLKQGYLLPLTCEITQEIREEKRLVRKHQKKASAEPVNAETKREWLLSVIDGDATFKEEQWHVVEAIYRDAVNDKEAGLQDFIRAYFRRTGTLWQMLVREINRIEAGDGAWWILCSLIDEQMKDRLVSEYQNQSLTNSQIRICLISMYTQHRYEECYVGEIYEYRFDQHYRKLAECYATRAERNLPEQKREAYEVLAVDGESAYETALTSKESYLVLVNELLKLGNRYDWTRIEFEEYPREILDCRLELKAVARDFYMSKDNMSIRKWMLCLDGRKWEHYASFYIYHWIRRHREKRVPEKIEQWVRQYYDNHINTVDFQGAIVWKTDSSMEYHAGIVDIITLFAARFRYDMPKEKAKELLFYSAYIGRGQRTWLPARYLTEAEIREQVIANLLSADLKGDVVRWHIRYCIDYRILECASVILKIARNPLRTVWVRRDALEYACGMMGIREACKSLLPGLKGELFFYVAEYFLESEDRELADMVWNYGEQCPRQKLRSDICLTLMQDRRGVESLRRHLQRRNGMPMEPVIPGTAEAVGNIRNVELTDELEKFLRAAWKPGFRDDPDDSLMNAAAAALIQIARSGPYAFERVMQIFARLLETYREEAEKVAAIRRWREEIRKKKQ